MVDNILEPGQVRTGQLVDGVDGTPYQSCTLTYETGFGPLLAVPFVDGVAQFDHTRAWFREQTPPKSLIFQDDIGSVTLAGLRWRGHSGATFMLGRLDADLTVFGEPRKLSREFRFKSLISTIDGLKEFANFHVLDSDIQPTESGHKVVVTIEATEEVKWRHGKFAYLIRANAPWSSTMGSDFTAHYEALIETTTSKRALANEHLAAQWPIRALLTLANGAKVRWRSHRVVDETFSPVVDPGQQQLSVPRTALLRRTIPDSEEASPERFDVAMPMFRLQHLGAPGLKKWCELYADEFFRRAIEPAVEVINGASKFVEPQLMMITLALDAMGYYRDPVRKSKTPLFKQIQRCMAATQIDWPEIGPVDGIARAIANTNNELKHPDRLNRPDVLQIGLLSNLAVIIMRFQLFDLLDLPDNLRSNFLASNAVRHAIEAFKLNRVTIDSVGALVRS